MVLTRGIRGFRRNRGIRRIWVYVIISGSRAAIPGRAFVEKFRNQRFPKRINILRCSALDTIQILIDFACLASADSPVHGTCVIDHQQLPRLHADLPFDGRDMEAALAVERIFRLQADVAIVMHQVPEPLACRFIDLVSHLRRSGDGIQHARKTREAKRVHGFRFVPAITVRSNVRK